MSLGVAFKGPEGIVLAADSRVTLFAELPGQGRVFPSTFDNANKLLRVPGIANVGAVTYGMGAFGQPPQHAPRTANSYMPEFESWLATERGVDLSTEKGAHVPVADFARHLSDFFLQQWTESGMPDADNYAGENLVFLVGGYDEGATYGRVFDVFIPNRPEPIEKHPGETFGISWGGQRELVDRLVNGLDPRTLPIVKNELQLTDQQVGQLEAKLKANLSLPIPYPFLPLQDCVDLSVFLVKVTMDLQTWQVAVRGVGGAIDVATVTRTEGIRALKEKEIAARLFRSPS